MGTPLRTRTVRFRVSWFLSAAAMAFVVGGIYTSAEGALLAAWEFNAADVSGSDVAASGGTAANTTGSLQDNAAVTGGALALDGAGDYLQFGNNVTDLRGLGAMTVAAWVRPGDSSGALRRTQAR